MNWPGIYADDYPDEIKNDPKHGDLPVLTDYRKTITEIFTKRVGITNPNTIFPTYTTTAPLGLT